MLKYLLFMMMACATLGKAQYVLDSTIFVGEYNTPRNTWHYTLAEMEIVYYVAWSAQLQPDTIKLRPKQWFSLLIEGGLFKVKLDTVSSGSFRRSYYTATWQRDTTASFSFDLPNLGYGVPDGNGFVKNPSRDSATTDRSVYFVFKFDSVSEVVCIKPLKIEGLLTTIQAHNLVYHFEAPVFQYNDLGMSMFDGDLFEIDNAKGSLYETAKEDSEKKKVFIEATSKNTAVKE